jgi:hypothetical protein
MTELDHLAHEIAYESARASIVSLCTPAADSCGLEEGWWDTNRPCEVEDVRKAVRYLELRGLLERHPQRNTCVKVRELEHSNQ